MVWQYLRMSVYDDTRLRLSTYTLLACTSHALETSNSKCKYAVLTISTEITLKGKLVNAKEAVLCITKKQLSKLFQPRRSIKIVPDKNYRQLFNLCRKQTYALLSYYFQLMGNNFGPIWIINCNYVDYYKPLNSVQHLCWSWLL